LILVGQSKDPFQGGKTKKKEKSACRGGNPEPSGDQKRRHSAEGGTRQQAGFKEGGTTQFKGGNFKEGEIPRIGQGSTENEKKNCPGHWTSREEGKK